MPDKLLKHAAQGSVSHPILDKLDPEFKARLTQVLLRCAEMGVQMRPYAGLRSPRDQAIEWRKGRTRSEINRAIEMLKQNNAEYLANVLYNVGPQNGRMSTNALPGQSWHQFGLAVDCFWVIDGRAEWDERKTISVKHEFRLSPNDRLHTWDGEFNGYEIYADVAGIYGLTAGRNWKFRDSVHVQLPSQPSPLSIYSWQNINNMMLTQFGEG